MSAQVVQSQFKTAYRGFRGFIEVKEEVEMRLAREITQVKTGVIQELATHLPAKLIGGLALGALLMMLPFAIVNADGPSRPLVNEEIVFDRSGDTLPIDAWMYDSPFYEDFGAINRVEVQGPSVDAWMYDPPFYPGFSEVGGVEVGTAALEAQG